MKHFYLFSKFWHEHLLTIFKRNRKLHKKRISNMGSVCFLGTLGCGYAWGYEYLRYGYECVCISLCLFEYMPVGAFLHMFDI